MMKCPECRFDNPDGARFCRKCGHELEIYCQVCGNVNPHGSKFCNECGQNLKEPQHIIHEIHPKPELQPSEFISEKPHATRGSIESERKQITVLFSDLTGYTAMSEKLDPEEVKEFMNLVFGGIAQVITKYGGFIDKFIGDAVMALFGVPNAHEDDPVRAIMAAREIHDLVEAMSPQVEGRTGKSISMHTGISTGLVVTGEMDTEKGKHGMTGNTINLASRLTDMAAAGQILVSRDTCRQSEGYFTFESLEPTRVKGKAEPVKIYRVLFAKKTPVTMHRLSGLRAELIGREAEMSQLGEAVEKLEEGQGGIVSISGDAGVGKSRLVEEFKATLNPREIQWREGHAYAYSQNIPYFPLIDLLSRVFQIEEGDSAEKVREKIESSIENLSGKRGDLIPYIGNLYALNYPEIEDVSPEFWKARLYEAIQMIFSGMARRAPTIIFLEDLHWADPSSVELLRLTLSNVRYPALFLCVSRPSFKILVDHQFNDVDGLYREIIIRDLSPSGTRAVVESLLGTKSALPALEKLIQEKVGGNPFYLEEVINSLIESEMLISENGTWKLTGPISKVHIPSTLQGVISARLDRLEKETKRMLQEASVIGSSFLYETLRRITDLKCDIDQRLGSLEKMDVIKKRSLQPDIEYTFKHVLTQEVVYNGLLKKDRQMIHERVALVMEELFQDRLSEYYEFLAFHFKEGHSFIKAVDYLIKSGEKCFGMYSVEESHQHYQEAFNLLTSHSCDTKREKEILIDLIMKWAYVYDRLGVYNDLIDLLRTHESLAESLEDKKRLGMFYGWLGFALRFKVKLNDSYRYLRMALELGEEINSYRVIGYASAWLLYTCSDMGRLDEAISFGKRAQEASGFLKSDQSFYQFYMVGMGATYLYRGEIKKTCEVGKSLIDCGQRNSDIRSTANGHMIVGWGHLVSGDFHSAIECFEQTMEISVDPVWSRFARLFLGIGYLSNGQLQKAEHNFEEIMKSGENLGNEFIATSAYGLLNVILIARGNISVGVNAVEHILGIFFENESRYHYATGEYFLGKVYLQIAQGHRPGSFAVLFKNLGFLLKNVPFAGRKAENHFNKAIEAAEEIGAKGVLGQAKLDLALLHKSKGRTGQARKCISEAIEVFEQCEAEVFLKQAREILLSL